MKSLAVDVVVGINSARPLIFPILSISSPLVFESSHATPGPSPPAASPTGAGMGGGWGERPLLVYSSFRVVSPFASFVETDVMSSSLSWRLAGSLLSSDHGTVRLLFGEDPRWMALAGGGSRSMCLNKLDGVCGTTDLVSFHLLLCWHGVGEGEVEMLASLVAANWWDGGTHECMRGIWML